MSLTKAKARKILEEYLDTNKLPSDILTAVNTLFSRSGYRLVKVDHKGKDIKSILEENRELKSIIDEMCDGCINPSGDCGECPMVKFTGGR